MFNKMSYAFFVGIDSVLVEFLILLFAIGFSDAGADVLEVACHQLIMLRLIEHLEYYIDKIIIM